MNPLLIPQRHRCEWATTHDLNLQYHDAEWGVPVFDDRLLFEFLILEGAQAGLSWLTILKKRDNYRRCFDYFSAEKIAGYDQRKVDELLKNPGIIRNRLKIAAAIKNAQSFLTVKLEFEHFSDYIWSFVQGQPIQNHWESSAQMPATSAISDLMAKDLKKRGFKFVGSTICYAFMQAVGMVNDHTTHCFRKDQVQR